jgi:hypothetical protein
MRDGRWIERLWRATRAVEFTVAVVVNLAALALLLTVLAYDFWFGLTR